MAGTSSGALKGRDKRKQTIIERYGSYSKMLAKRDIGDLILGGYNGGKRKGKKGTAAWEPGKNQALAKTRERDEYGRFIPKEKAPVTHRITQPKDQSWKSDLFRKS